MANKSNTYRRRRNSRPNNNKRPKFLSVLLILVLLGIGVIYAFDYTEASTGITFQDKDLERVVIPDETPEIIKEYTGLVVSFNPAHHIPNYVVWELTETEAQGTEPRSSKFKVDPDVLGCPTLEDYRNSGFDRGHMAPAGDMKWSAQAMLDSHYLTNMCPQDRSINSGRWSTLESKCRQWALRDSSLIIVSGPILSDELTRAIGRTQVSVPERFFKVILAPYANPPRAIGFIVPNSPTSDGVESMAVSVDRVEEITGFDFFSALPDDVENTIEAQTNYRDWNRRKR